MSRYAASSTLTHYFRTLFRAAGLKWDGDNSAEIESLIDDIIDAAVAEAVAKISPPPPRSPFTPSKPHIEEEEDGDALEAALDKLLSDGHDDGHDDGALPSPNDLDLSDDGDALASAGFGTDEDYGGNDRDDF